MHELSYVVRFVNRALEIAEENHADRIKKLVVHVGEMTDVVPEYLHKYYPEAVQGTILEGSVLETEPVPVRMRCGACGREYHPDREHDYLCPECGGGTGKLLAGREITIKELEIETED